LATGRIVYIRPDEFFDFGFKTEMVELGKKNDKFYRFHFSIMNKQNEFERSAKASLGMDCFFLRKV